MTFLRLRLLLLAAFGLYGPEAIAQESSGSAGTGSSGGSSAGQSTGSGTTGSGASSSFGTPSAGGASNPFATTPSAPSTNSAAPSFRTGEGNAIPGAAPEPTTPAPGAATTFGTEQTGPNLTRTPPTTFSIPGFYGRGSQQFVVGEGRLARPRFRFNGKVSTGYDDNVFQTPTAGQSVRPQKIPILVTPGSPGGTAVVEVPSGDPLVPNTEQTVEIPAVKPKFRFEKIPGVPAPERIGSFVTRASLGWDIQMASRRDLFTFDFDAGTSYYWDRPGKKSEYTGDLSLIYLRKLTGRAQFTIAVDASYQSQPNFAQVNTPTNNNRGSYLSTNIKADLSYRLTPRFSTVTSVGYNSVYSAEQAERSTDFSETTIGTELRYLFSPRITLLGEVRYSSSVHDENSALDTTNYSLLIGGELALTRRFKASLRLGESIQSYTELGGKSSSPYVETTLDYRLGRGTTIQWNGRYGFEESGVVNSESIVARSGLVLTQIFSPRLQASLSLNLLHNQTTTTTEVLVTPPASDSTNSTSNGTDTSTDTTPAKPRTKAVSVETVQDTIDGTLGLQYTLSRHWSFNLSYTYTTALGPTDFSDYYRQQIFLGAEFQF